MNWKERQRRLQGELARARFDALLVTHLPNIRYLCGFTGSAGVLLVAQKQSVFFTDGRYTQQARDEVSSARIIAGRKPPLALLVEWFRGYTGSRAIKKVGFEGERISFSTYRSLHDSLPGWVRLRPAPTLVEGFRTIKDSEELAQIRAAALLGVKLFDRAVEVIRPGVEEGQVAAEMEYVASNAGAEDMSFSTIIAAGQRSALPHGRASRQPIPPDGFVVCDFGVILAGYCSDMTRTVYVGQPSAEARSAYTSVREAQQAALEAVRPGAKLSEVDGAARKLLQKHKLAKYFTHSTGHGVGLEIHEAPRVAAGQQDELRPGMVITIEPGIYLPGKWGIRIEDMVAVTDRGCEVLTPATKELVVC